MSVYGFVKFSIGLFVLLGIGLMLISLAKIWDAYHDYRHAQQVPGIFKGYHSEEHVERFRNSNGRSYYSKVSEYFPMFVYQDADGVSHGITADESHFFRYLDYGDSVDVLLPANSQDTPRLGDFFSLYGTSMLLMLVAGIFILLPLKALGFIRRWLHDRHDDENVSQLQSQLLNRSNSTIKFGDLFLYLFILLALFAIGAGAMLYFTTVANTHDAITVNRQSSPALAAPGYF